MLIITAEVQDMTLYEDNTMEALRAIRGLSGMTLKDARKAVLALKTGPGVFESNQNVDFLNRLADVGVKITGPRPAQQVQPTETRRRLISIEVEDMHVYGHNIMAVLKAIRNLSGMTLMDARDITQGLKKGKQFDFESDQNAAFLKLLTDAGIKIKVHSLRPAIINDTLRAYYDGETLNDANLVKLHAHVMKTAKMLSQLGDRFHLAMVECIRIGDITNGFIKTRGLKVGPWKEPR